MIYRMKHDNIVIETDDEARKGQLADQGYTDITEYPKNADKGPGDGQGNVDGQ